MFLHQLNWFSYCDEIEVIPFSYDLSQVRELVDSLLLAYYLAPSITCCDASTSFFPGLWDTINAMGIYSGNDVHSLDDLITVLLFLSEQVVLTRPH